jgi:hypothetical protein
MHVYIVVFRDSNGLFIPGDGGRWKIHRGSHACSVKLGIRSSDVNALASEGNKDFPSFDCRVMQHERARCLMC